MSFAFGIGIGSRNQKQEWLEVYYQHPVYQPDAELARLVRENVDGLEGNAAAKADANQLQALADAFEEAGYEDQARLADQSSESSLPVVVTLLDTDEKASTTPRSTSSSTCCRTGWSNPMGSTSMASSRCFPTWRGPMKAPLTWRNCPSANSRPGPPDASWK